MPRNLKFRVWCHDFQEWEKDEIFLDKEGLPWHYSPEKGMRLIKPQGHTVQLFTGFHDETGRRIYEGDILYISCGRKKDLEDPFTEVKDVVTVSASRAFRFNGEDLYLYSGKVKIIGNVLENPKLIKK